MGKATIQNSLDHGCGKKSIPAGTDTNEIIAAGLIVISARRNGGDAATLFSRLVDNVRQMNGRAGQILAPVNDVTGIEKIHGVIHFEGTEISRICRASGIVTQCPPGGGCPQGIKKILTATGKGTPVSVMADMEHGSRLATQGRDLFGNQIQGLIPVNG